MNFQRTHQVTDDLSPFLKAVKALGSAQPVALNLHSIEIHSKRV